MARANRFQCPQPNRPAQTTRRPQRANHRNSMAALTERDKRTIRLASIGIGIYLVLFFGVTGWKKLERKRADYQTLLAKVRKEESDARDYETRILLFEKYRDLYRLD